MNRETARRISSNKHFMFRILTILPALFLILSSACLSYIDKSAFNTAMYILLRLPMVYYLGLSLLVLVFLIGSLKQHIRVHESIFLVFIFVAYLELPRLMYPNGFQTEYFHQAQVFHVINYGVVTDRFYPFPRSDIVHAIFSASLIEITGLDSMATISHIVPILLRVSLVLATLPIALQVKGGFNRALFALIIPLYLIASDTEPTFVNHYIYALPLYALLIFASMKLLVDHNSRSLKVLILLIWSSLVFTHIYFATLSTGALVVFLTYCGIMGLAERGRRLIDIGIPAILIFMLWHGYVSSWSIHQFHKELANTLSIAFERALTFHVNPLNPVIEAHGRFGGIPMKADYTMLLWVKWWLVMLLNVLVMGVALTILYSSIRRLGFINTVRTLFASYLTWLWATSAVFLVIYGLTGTAHVQRVLETFIVPNAALLVYLLRNYNAHSRCGRGTEKCVVARSSKAVTTALLILVIISASAIVLKPVSYWGTSLTYIGFTQKYEKEFIYIYNFHSSEINSVHFIGSDPYWFFSDIHSGSRMRTKSMNAPIYNSSAWMRTLKNSLNSSGPHYMLVDFTSSIMPMEAKYDLRPYLQQILKNVHNEITEAPAVIYMNSPCTLIALKT